MKVFLVWSTQDDGEGNEKTFFHATRFSIEDASKRAKELAETFVKEAKEFFNRKDNEFQILDSDDASEVDNDFTIVENGGIVATFYAGLVEDSK